MAVSLSLLAGAGWQFLDDSATPLTGGLLYTYSAGTTTPLTTYTSSSGATPNSNPIVLDAAGRVAEEIWLTVGSNYKFVLKNSGGVTIWTKDNILGGSSADTVTFLQAGTGAVTRTAQDKLRESVSPEDYGAVGDGTADDTQAVLRVIAAVNADSAIRRLEVTRIYSIDFTALTNNRFTITRDNLLITGGGTIIAKTANYSSGVAAGAFKYYTVFYCTGNRVTVENITFDGNNQFSQYPSSGVLANYWLLGVRFQGTSTSVRTSGGKVQNCRYINGGGWPFTGQFHNYGVIHGCYADNSQGIGFDGGSLCVVSDNISRIAHDAHFATWNSIGAVISGNTCDTSDNGSGIDVSGSKDCTIIGNTIRACYNRGIWVLQDPNTANQPYNVTIQGNTFYNNNVYAPISEKGDIQVGPIDVTTDSRSAGTIDVAGLTIVGNTFWTYNNANCITLGKYAFNVLIDGNTFIDQASSAANRAVVMYNSGTVVMRNNNDMIARRKGVGSAPKVLGSGPVFFDGVDSELDTSVATGAMGTVQKTFFKETTRRTNAGKAYQIEERFGYTVLSAEITYSASSLDVANIAFNSGGFEVADIEVIATVGGDRGTRRNRVTYQGYSAISPSQIVAATDYYSGGSVPPTITYTASTGNLKISVNSNASIFGTVTVIVYGTRATGLTCLL